MKLRKGNDFPSVCQEFCPQRGGVVSARYPLHRLGTHPPGQTKQTAPHRQTPPWMGTATATDGTHSTGMHSCFNF